MILGGVPLFALSAGVESGQWVNINFSGWMAIAYATIFGSAIAYGLFFYFASSGNLTSLSALTFLTPIFALLFGNLFLSEVLTPIQSLGVCLTLVSIYLVNQRENLAKFSQRFHKEEQQDKLLNSSNESSQVPISLSVSETESEMR